MTDIEDELRILWGEVAALKLIVMAMAYEDMAALTPDEIREAFREFRKSQLIVPHDAQTESQREELLARWKAIGLKVTENLTMIGEQIAATRLSQSESPPVKPRTSGARRRR